MNRLWTAAALLVLGTLLAACNEDVNAGSNKGARVDSGDKYVALGDSFTSGPRLGEDTGGDGCEQTDGNYPHLVAERLQLELVDVSCGGAKTESLRRPHTPPGGSRQEPQLDAVTEDTSLVTLSIGANDNNLYGNLMVRCVNLGRSEPEGAPCATLAQMADGRIAKEIEEVSEEIEEAVGEILDRAPRARVIVVGYPQIVPESRVCDQLPLATGDYPYAHSVMYQITKAQENAAEAANAEYVDAYSATAGHDICADDPWIAGVKPEKPALPYHPYAAEQKFVADLVVEMVAGS